MLIPKIRSSADYRAQAAHIREFLETVHDDDQLRAVLLDAATRLDQLANEAETPDLRAIKEKLRRSECLRRYSRKKLRS